MRVIIVLCSVVFFASCIGAYEDGLKPGTEEGDERLRFTPSMCPQPESRLSEIVTRAGNQCIKMVATEVEPSHPLRGAQTIEQYRNFFNNFCQKQSSTRSCLAETTVNMEVCQNETFVDTFKIYRDTIETVLNIGCNEDGEQLSTLLFEVADFARTKQNIDHARKCSDRNKLMLEELDISSIDISSKLYLLHKEIEIHAACFNRLELKQSFKDVLKNFVDVIINKMKCIHPQDGTLVPCLTIDASLISTTNVCDLMTIGSERSLYDVLEEDSGACTMRFLRYADEDVDDNDTIRDLVEADCKYRTRLPYCYNTSKIISDICLNDTQQAEFNLLGDFIKSAYEVGCFEDGRRLSEITYEVYRLKRSGQGHAVGDCMGVAKSARSATGEHMNISKNMRFYHDMLTFKGCLIDKLQGDQTSVAAATSLMDELLKKVKCVHPEEGTPVLCETIHTKV